jgi:hypothetical protein
MKKTIAMAITFITLIVIDGALTFWATNNGYTEVNPLMAPIANTILFPVLKTITVLIGVAIVGYLLKRFPKFIMVANFGFISMIGFYGIVLASNLVEIF